MITHHLIGTQYVIITSTEEEILAFPSNEKGLIETYNEYYGYKEDNLIENYEKHHEEMKTILARWWSRTSNEQVTITKTITC